MFGYSDKATLTGFNAYNKKNELLDYVISFPITEDIEIPKDIREISIIEGQNESDLQRCKTSFKIYVGKIGDLRSLMDDGMIGDDKYHVTFDKDNIVDELGKLSTPICYYIKDNLIHVVAILNSGDKVVANTEELKSLLLEISMHFEEYQEAIEGIKLSTGKVKTFNNAKK